MTTETNTPGPGGISPARSAYEAWRHHSTPADKPLINPLEAWFDGLDDDGRAAWDAAAKAAVDASLTAADDGTLERLLTIIREVDAHLDAASADGYREQPLAGHWARITKVCEEAGEVWKALSKATGENPRKGTCGTWGDVLEELADTLCAAACAIQHVTKDERQTAAVIMAAFEKAHRRVAEFAGSQP